MSAFYTEMADVAVELIEEFGAPVTLNRVTGESYDPVTGNLTDPGAEDSKNTMGLLVSFPTDLIDGTRILATDKRLIVDGSVEPRMSDVPEMFGEKLGTIVHIDKKSPAGVPLVYFLQVRK